MSFLSFLRFARTSTVGVVTSVAAITLTSAARADELDERTRDPRFGSGRLGRGSVVFPDLFGFSSLPIAGPSNAGGALFTGPVSFGFSSSRGGSRWSVIGVAPSFDVFVTDRFTMGGRLVALRNTATYPVFGVGAVGGLGAGGVSGVGGLASVGAVESEGYAISIAPRVGYLLPLSESVAFWPQLGVAMNQTRSEADGVGRTLTRGFGVELEAALLLPLGRHVVVRLAPTLTYNHASSDGQLVEEGEAVRGGVRAQMGLAF